MRLFRFNGLETYAAIFEINFVDGTIIALTRRFAALSAVGAVCDRASFPRCEKTLDLQEKRAVTDRAYS